MNVNMITGDIFLEEFVEPINLILLDTFINEDLEFEYESMMMPQSDIDEVIDIISDIEDSY